MCHFPCEIADDGEIWKCAAMDNGGKHSAKCERCDGKCSWKLHKSTSERFELDYKTETRTNYDLKMKFDVAANKKAAKEKLIHDIAMRLEDTESRMFSSIDNGRTCLSILKQIALKPNPLTQVEYIVLMVESEISQKKEGWNDRVKYLTASKERAILLEMVVAGRERSLDDHIEKEKKERKPGWEQKVQGLEKMQRIQENSYQTSKEEKWMVHNSIYLAGVK